MKLYVQSQTENCTHKMLIMNNNHLSRHGKAYFKLHIFQNIQNKMQLGKKMNNSLTNMNNDSEI